MTQRGRGLWLGLILIALGALTPSPGSTAVPDQVTVAIYRYGAPFTLVDPLGDPAGLLVQMWQLWAQSTGVAVQFLATGWADSLDAVHDGRADIHSGLFQTPGRAAWMEFSDPLHEVETALYARTGDDRSLEDPSAFAGGTIGAVSGSYQLTWLQERTPHVETIGFPNSYSAFLALLSGDIDAVLDEAPAASAAIAQLGLPGSFARGAAPLFTEQLRAGVRAGAYDLLHLINEGFRAIPRSDLAALDALWLPNPADRYYAGGSGAITFTEPEQAWLDAHPVIRMGVNTAFPPYGFLDEDGILTGFEPELIHLLNRKLGTQIVPETYDTWQRQLSAALNWEVDGTMGISSSPERAERLLFTQPYHYDPLVFVTRSDATAVQDWEDLAGKRVSIEGGVHLGLDLQRMIGTDGQVREVANDKVGFDLVHSGQIDGHLTFRTPFESHRAAGLAEGLVVRLTRNIATSGMHIGVPTDRRPLLGILRKGLNAISIAEWSELRERWFTPSDGLDRRSVELSPREMRWLQAHSVVKVANELDWPPFDFAEDGEPRGFSIDILKLAARKVGLRLEFVNGYSWAELMALFRAGKLDILPAVYQTPERRTFIAFTRSYSTNPSMLVTRAGRTDIRLPEDLQGRRTAVVRGFATALVMAERWPGIEQVEVANVLAGLKAVSLGTVDAFVGSLGVISYVLKETYIPNIQVVNEVTIKNPDETRLHMGVARDREVLRDLLQKGLDAISAAEMTELRNRWLPFSDALTGSDATLGVTLTGEQRLWIAEHRDLRVGGAFDAPPFSFLDDNGDFAGISAGYLEAAASRLKLKLTTDPAPSRAVARQRLRAGEIDVLPGIVAADPANAPAGLLVSAPYVSFPIVIATRRDARFVADLSDLTGRRVGVGTRHLDPARWQARYPDHAFVPMETATAGVTALAEGTIDAYLDDLGSVTYAIDRAGDDAVKIAAPTEESIALAVAVRPDWPELVGIFDAAFASLSDAERRAIKNSWLAVTVSFGLDLGTVLLWTVPFALSALAIMAVILIWNRRLGAEIAERKEAQARLSDAHELIQSSISYASHIQRSLLPDVAGLTEPPPTRNATPGDGVGTGGIPLSEHFVVWEPRDLVGGDMLWTRPWGDGTLLILADCTGHGVPGAFMTLIATGALDRARLEVPPGELGALVQRVHQLVQTTLRQHSANGRSDDGLELGACFIRCAAATPQLTFCGARFPLFTAIDTRVAEVKGSRRPLGYRSVPFNQSFSAVDIAVQPGMTFYLASDGLIDQIGGPRRRAFGRRQFTALLARLAEVPLPQQGAHIMAALLEHQGSERRRDDVSVIGFRLA